jgi:hypothetical protein
MVVCLCSLTVSSKSVSETMFCASLRQLQSLRFCLMTTGSSSDSDSAGTGSGLCGNGTEGSGSGEDSAATGTGVMSSLRPSFAASALSRAAATALRGFPLVVAIAKLLLAMMCECFRTRLCTATLTSRSHSVASLPLSWHHEVWCSIGTLNARSQARES